MTWKQIRSVAEKQGLSCKRVYELVVAQKPTTNTGSPKFSLDDIEKLCTEYCSSPEGDDYDNWVGACCFRDFILRKHRAGA